MWLHRDESHRLIRVLETLGNRNLPLPDAQPWACTQAAAICLLAQFLRHFLIYNLMTEQRHSAPIVGARNYRVPRRRFWWLADQGTVGDLLGDLAPGSQGTSWSGQAPSSKARAPNSVIHRGTKTYGYPYQATIPARHSGPLCREGDFPTGDRV